MASYFPEHRGDLALCQGRNPPPPCIPCLRSPLPDQREPGRGLTFGFEALTVSAFPGLLSSNVLLQRGSFSSSCWLGLVLHVLCAECKWFSSLWAETPHSSQDMGSAGLSMPALSPSLPASGQHLSCRREPGRGLTFRFEAPQLIFLSVRFVIREPLPGWRTGLVPRWQCAAKPTC